MSDLTPQQRRQQRTYEAILTTARELIAENSADKLSLRAIARRIDYSPARLYEPRTCGVGCFRTDSPRGWLYWQVA